MAQYPLETTPPNEKLMPSLYDIANKKIPNASCYSRQKGILAMSQRGLPASPALQQAVQSQLKPMPISVTLQANPHPQIMNPVPGPKGGADGSPCVG